MAYRPGIRIGGLPSTPYPVEKDSLGAEALATLGTTAYTTMSTVDSIQRRKLNDSGVLEITDAEGNPILKKKPKPKLTDSVSDRTTYNSNSLNRKIQVDDNLFTDPNARLAEQARIDNLTPEEVKLHNYSEDLSKLESQGLSKPEAQEFMRGGDDVNLVEQQYNQMQSEIQQEQITAEITEIPVDDITTKVERVPTGTESIKTTKPLDVNQYTKDPVKWAIEKETAATTAGKETAATAAADTSIVSPATSATSTTTTASEIAKRTPKGRWKPGKTGAEGTKIPEPFKAPQYGPKSYPKFGKEPQNILKGVPETKVAGKEVVPKSKTPGTHEGFMGKFGTGEGFLSTIGKGGSGFMGKLGTGTGAMAEGFKALKAGTSAFGKVGAFMASPAGLALGVIAMIGLLDDDGPLKKLFSDIALKENLKKVNNSPSGIPIYEFNYIGDKTRQKFKGVLAQDVPWASTVDPGTGYKMVDYSKIDVDFEFIN